jgi:protein-S-isoprenylcysteine O-methyltransferase Ste14
MRVARGLWAGLAAASPLAIPLLVSALWVADPAVLARAAWLIAGVLAISSIAHLSMALRRPANLEMRRQRPIVARAKKQPLVDAVGVMAFLVYLMGWFAFIPIDAGRLRLLPLPPGWIMAAGLAAAMLGSILGHLAVWENAFATPAIQQQVGQKVIDTGLYGVVRHPLYAGNLLFFAGSALWLGSLAALLGVSVILVATLARVAIEERYLRDALPGYRQYARRVRARLIPFVI